MSLINVHEAVINVFIDSDGWAMRRTLPLFDTRVCLFSCVSCWRCSSEPSPRWTHPFGDYYLLPFYLKWKLSVILRMLDQMPCQNACGLYLIKFHLAASWTHLGLISPPVHLAPDCHNTRLPPPLGLHYHTWASLVILCSCVCLILATGTKYGHFVHLLHKPAFVTRKGIVHPQATNLVLQTFPGE